MYDWSSFLKKKIFVKLSIEFVPYTAAAAVEWMHATFTHEIDKMHALHSRRHTSACVPACVRASVCVCKRVKV